MSLPTSSKGLRRPRRRRRSRSYALSWAREAVGGWQLGVVLLILTLLLVVDLFALPPSWQPLSRRLFGWGAYPFTVVLLLGAVVRLAMRGPARVGWEPFVGAAISLVSLIALSHSWDPSADPLRLAEQGKGGGFIGWAISSLLYEWPGPVFGRVLLVALFGAGVWILWAWSPLTWRERAAALVEAAAERFGVGLVIDEIEGPDLGSIGSLDDEPVTREQGARRAGTKATRRGKRTRRKKTSRTWTRDEALPPLDLLHLDRATEFGDSNADYKAEIIEQTLNEFGVPVRVVEVKQGPTVTQFGVRPLSISRQRSDGTTYERKVSVKRIVRLGNDLALALAASPIRIEAPVPGYPYVGIEVPNDKVALVALRGVMESPEFAEIVRTSNLAVALGRDVSGEPLVADLAAMPHLLIAGATGSGKSVCINSIVTCLLLNNTPDTLQLLMMDPKMVELPAYDGVPHLIAPAVVDLEHAVHALAWLTLQMDERYRQFHAVGARSIHDYNTIARRRKNLDTLPHIVLVIDELADMMMMAPDEVERTICRLSQMARATGIHLIIATQRPSVDVVTGLIKANFPARIAFTVTSQVDSRVILDQGGAEQLLGRGDMLFMSPDAAALQRAQGCFVSSREISAVVRHWRTVAAQAAVEEMEDEEAPPWEGLPVLAEGSDELLGPALELLQESERVSTSYLQRKLRVGYPRAARLIEFLEEQGLVGPDEGGGRGREVLLVTEDTGGEE